MLMSLPNTLILPTSSLQKDLPEHTTHLQARAGRVWNVEDLHRNQPSQRFYQTPSPWCSDTVCTKKDASLSQLRAERLGKSPTDSRVCLQQCQKCEHRLHAFRVELRLSPSRFLRRKPQSPLKAKAADELAAELKELMSMRTSTTLSNFKNKSTVKAWSLGVRSRR